MKLGIRVFGGVAVGLLMMACGSVTPEVKPEPTSAPVSAQPPEQALAQPLASEQPSEQVSAQPSEQAPAQPPAKPCPYVEARGTYSTREEACAMSRQQAPRFCAERGGVKSIGDDCMATDGPPYQGAYRVCCND
ncbi:hypothetical protein QEG98_29815 [Myxococcus sp. MxC21-1]|uniref:hypothetical protein n=1 Tax=Myxococcus sp. MxC21-1 TaxID=3041439 RepID=UPI002930A06F|nr:hypothetical protein [Myxococcus sp. MxC21-1]WNZ60177.1 hypothetical protein QEG98_29815 [Myxococcus sp. MxC21-1]